MAWTPQEQKEWMAEHQKLMQLMMDQGETQRTPPIENAAQVSAGRAYG